MGEKNTFSRVLVCHGNPDAFPVPRGCEYRMMITRIGVKISDIDRELAGEWLSFHGGPTGHTKFQILPGTEFTR